MRIAIATYHYPPEISGGTARPLLLEQELIRRGHQVILITPQPTTPGIKGGDTIPVVPPHKRKETPATGMKRKLVGVAGKVLNMTLLPDRLALWARGAANRAIERLEEAPPDMIFSTSPPESVHLIGRRIAERFAIPWIADFRDGWICEPLRAETNWPIRGWMERRMERDIFERADRLTFASRMTLDDARRRHSSLASKMSYFPTGYGADGIRHETPSPDRFLLAYAGRFGLSHATRTPGPFVEGVVRFLAARKVADERFGISLMGDYTDAERRAMAPLTHRGVLSLEPPLVHSAMLDRLADATALLMVTAPGHLTAAPRKLFDYLGVGRPILALSVGTEASRIVKETGAGLCVAPDDPVSIAEGLGRLYDAWEKGLLAKAYPGDTRQTYAAENIIDRFLEETGLIR